MWLVTRSIACKSAACDELVYVTGGVLSDTPYIHTSIAIELVYVTGSVLSDTSAVLALSDLSMGLVLSDTSTVLALIVGCENVIV